MKNTILIIAFGYIGFCGKAQDEAVLEVFYQQIEAFNTQDVDKLVENISDDFTWYYIASDSLVPDVKGKEAFREAMTSYFEAIPSVTTTIESVTVANGKVSFKETVSYTTKKGGQGKASALGIYQIREGKIRRAWYFME